MIYLLDTNVCVAYLNGRSTKVVTRIDTTIDQDIVVCSVVKAELFTGSAKSESPTKTRARHNAFLARFASLTFDDETAEEYAEIRARLEKAGTPIGGNDLMIAAIALANNLILITHKTEEFSRVSGLKLEDWEA